MKKWMIVIVVAVLTVSYVLFQSLGQRKQTPAVASQRHRAQPTVKQETEPRQQDERPLWESQLLVPDSVRTIIPAPISDVPIAEEYEELKQAALLGDVEAAYVLGEKLRRCAGGMLSDTELERTIARMYERSSVEDPQTGDSYHVQDIAPHVQNVRELHDYCRQLSPEYAEEHSEWTETAAQQGHIPAVIRFVTNVPMLEPGSDEGDVYLQKREEYLHESWDTKGSVDSAFWLGMDLYNGIALEKNLEEAFAYLLTAYKARGDSGKYDTMVTLLDEIYLALSPHSAEMAMAKSQALLQNPNCCAVIGIDSATH